MTPYNPINLFVGVTTEVGAMAPRTSPWLSRGQAADHIGCSVATLAAHAFEDAKNPPPKGPPFWKPMFASRSGATRYHRDALDRWIMGDRRLVGLQSVVVYQHVTEELSHRPEFIDIGDGIVVSGEPDWLTRVRKPSNMFERADWDAADAEVQAVLSKLRAAAG